MLHSLLMQDNTVVLTPQEEVAIEESTADPEEAVAAQNMGKI